MYHMNKLDKIAKNIGRHWSKTQMYKKLSYAAERTYLKLYSVWQQREPT